MASEEGRRILLIEPPYYSLFEEDCRHTLPLGILYVASYLRGEGHDVRVYNADTVTTWMGAKPLRHPSRYDYDRYRRNVTNPDSLPWIKLGKAVESEKPDIVGISANTLTRASARRTAEAVKAIDPKVTVVAGGPETTLRPEGMLDGGIIDYAVRGEGEATMAELIDAILGKGPLTGVDGISYRDGGKTVHNKPRRFFKDLDRLPYPARDLLLDAEHWRPEYMGSMVTGRGCPFSCAFCSTGVVWGGMHRQRSPENVIGEIKAVHDRWGTKHFSFQDDTFYSSGGRVMRICELIDGVGFDMEWGCLMRADIADADVMGRMVGCGLRYVDVGVESGSPAILKAMDKRLDIGRLKMNVRLLKDSGVRVVANFILGYPGETKATLEETKRLIAELDCETSVELFYPFPGTRAYEELKAAGRLLPVPEDEHNDYFTQVFVNDSIEFGYLAEEYRKMTSEGG